MASEINYSSLENALRELLAALPEDLAAGTSSLDPVKVKRLRADIAKALDRLIPLSRALDPIKQPPFVFDPTNPEIVGQLIGRTMMEQSRYRLSAVPRMYGSGVYALYYSGNFDAYKAIRGSERPIYVGKADPPTPEAKTVEEQGPKLSTRLREHAKSIRAVGSTLDIADFECRFLVVQSGWQRAAEDYLLSRFKPVWNSPVCYGFGKHGDAPTTRANTRSPWDTLHPGREWAARAGNVPNPASLAEIKRLVGEHFAKHLAKA